MKKKNEILLNLLGNNEKSIIKLTTEYGKIYDLTDINNLFGLLVDCEDWKNHKYEWL